MKKFVTFQFLFFVFASVFSKPVQPLEIVQEYSDNLRAWCTTKNISKYSNAIKDLCSDGFRVNDDIISDYVKRTGMQPLKHYDFNDYEKCLDDIIRKGVSISVKDIVIDNSVEFKFGNSDKEIATFVSAELTVAGALNYKVKEIFKIKNGKITFIRNYENDLTLNRAFIYCKEKKYKEAFEQFEKIIKNSNNWGEKQIAEQFSISLLIKKSSKLKLNDHIRNYKLAHLLLKDKTGAQDWRTGNYPVLDDNNFEYHSDQYQYKERPITLPFKWWEKNNIPYLNDKEGGHGAERYYYYTKVFIPYRDLEKYRFPFKIDDKYGYLDESGERVIPAQYLFAYPFDEKYGIALVQQPNKKWGYIDMKGNPIGSQDYDVCSDVFVNGKTFVIKENYLYLIDTKGRVLKSLYGYTDLCHKKLRDEIIAINGEDSIRYDSFDFNGNLIKKSVRVYEDYTGGCSLRWKRSVIGHLLDGTERIQTNGAVDLGLSVKWAGTDLGASSPGDSGFYCGWADPTGKEKTTEGLWQNGKWVSSLYGGPNPPQNITGSSLDVATNLWGKSWRLPTKIECEELINRCSWKIVNYKNKLKYLVTGPNGNSIIMEYGSHQLTAYWTSNLSSKGGAYALEVKYNKKPSVDSRSRVSFCLIRPVKND